MKRFLGFLLVAFVIAGCGTNDGDKYQTTGNAVPDVPTDGAAYIVQASGGSSAGMQYTELEDGSILVQCGDGDGYNCQVYTAKVIDTQEVNASVDENSSGF